MPLSHQLQAPARRRSSVRNVFNQVVAVTAMQRADAGTPEEGGDAQLVDAPKFSAWNVDFSLGDGWWHEIISFEDSWGIMGKCTSGLGAGHPVLNKLFFRGGGGLEVRMG